MENYVRVFARIMPSVHEIREDELVSVEGGSIAPQHTLPTLVYMVSSFLIIFHSNILLTTVFWRYLFHTTLLFSAA